MAFQSDADLRAENVPVVQRQRENMRRYVDNLFMNLTDDEVSQVDKYARSIKDDPDNPQASSGQSPKQEEGPDIYAMIAAARNRKDVNYEDIGSWDVSKDELQIIYGNFKTPASAEEVAKAATET